MLKTSFWIKVNFNEAILGSWPASKDLLSKYVAEKAPSPWQQEEEMEAGLMSEDIIERNLTVFPRDNEGIFLFDFHLKGFIKEAGNVLKNSVGIKNLRSKIDTYVFIRPRRLYLLNEKGENITEPNDIFERPLRAQTMQGPRVALTASERLSPPCHFYAKIEILENTEVDEKLIKHLLDYGQYKGLGQWRNGGFGSFNWEEVNSEFIVLGEKTPTSRNESE